MALRAGYFGLKRRLLKKLEDLPGIKSIGDGLSLNATTGALTATADIDVQGNPEGTVTAGNLTKLKIGDDIFNVPDTTYSDATTTTSGLMSAADKIKVDDIGKYEEISATDDLDNCTDIQTTYMIKNAFVPLNAPEADAYNALIWNIGEIGAGKYLIQYYSSSNKKAIYFRFNAGATWQVWNKITSTQVTSTQLSQSKNGDDTIPEEVSEEVTKKRTIKKTAKEGE